MGYNFVELPMPHRKTFRKSSGFVYPGSPNVNAIHRSANIKGVQYLYSSSVS